MLAYIPARYATDRRARLARSRNALVTCQSAIDLFHLVEEIARLRAHRETCPQTTPVLSRETVNPTGLRVLHRVPTGVPTETQPAVRLMACQDVKLAPVGTRNRYDSDFMANRSGLVFQLET